MKKIITTVIAALSLSIVALLPSSAMTQTSQDLDYVIFTNLTIGQLMDLRENFSEGRDTERRFDSLLFAYISGTRDGMAQDLAIRRGMRADGSFDAVFATNIEKCMLAPHPRDIMDELYSTADESGLANRDFSTWLHEKLSGTDC